MTTEEIEQLQRAAAGGDAEAWYKLGLLHDNGEGAERDAAKAANCYREAVELGHALAMNNLGVMTLNGDGVSQNAPLAFNLIKMSATRGNAQAMFNLGLLFERGLGTTADRTPAIEWMERARQNGHEGAAEALTRLQAAPAPSETPASGPTASESSSDERMQGAYFTPPTPAIQRLWRRASRLRDVGIGIGIMGLLLLGQALISASSDDLYVQSGQTFTVDTAFEYYRGVGGTKYQILSSDEIQDMAARAQWALPAGFAMVTQQVSAGSASVTWTTGNTRNTAGGARFTATATLRCETSTADGAYKLAINVPNTGSYVKSDTLHSGAPTITVIVGGTTPSTRRAVAIGLLGACALLLFADFMTRRAAARRRDAAQILPDEVILYRRRYTQTQTGRVIFNLCATRRALYWDQDRVPASEVASITWKPSHNLLTLRHDGGHTYNLSRPLKTDPALIKEIAGELEQLAKAFGLAFEK